MPKVLKIVGTAADGPATGKTAGEDIILVGDTMDIKGTKGNTGPAGAAGTTITVDTGGTVTLDTGSMTGVVDLGDGHYLPVYGE